MKFYVFVKPKKCNGHLCEIFAFSSLLFENFARAYGAGQLSVSFAETCAFGAGHLAANIADIGTFGHLSEIFTAFENKKSAT